MTKTLDSTAVYAYTTLISAIVCLPFALIAEGGVLQSGAAAAIAKVRRYPPTQAEHGWRGLRDSLQLACPEGKQQSP